MFETHIFSFINEVAFADNEPQFHFNKVIFTFQRKVAFFKSWTYLLQLRQRKSLFATEAFAKYKAITSWQ